MSLVTRPAPNSSPTARMKRSHPPCAEPGYHSSIRIIRIIRAWTSGLIIGDAKRIWHLRAERRGRREMTIGRTGCGFGRVSGLRVVLACLRERHELWESMSLTSLMSVQAVVEDTCQKRFFLIQRHCIVGRCAYDDVDDLSLRTARPADAALSADCMSSLSLSRNNNDKNCPLPSSIGPNLAKLLGTI